MALSSIPRTDNNAYSEIVTGPFDEARVREAADRAAAHNGGNSTIAFVFCSCDYAAHMSDFVELVQIHARCPRVVGCTATGVIGTGREEEGMSGFSLLVLHLPATEICVADLEAPASWNRARTWNDGGCAGWIVIGNPLVVGEEWLAEWNAAMGAVPTFGGLASGSHRGEDLLLFDEHGIADSAAIAVGFRGGVRLSGLVSQGCRPIGEPLTITRAEENKIYQIASTNAYDQLQTAFQSLPAKLREKAQGNILVGLAMSEYVEDFRAGDFLIRSIIGGDPSAGALAVQAVPRVGQTCQFQLRDQEAADEELRELLARKGSSLTQMPFASLLFSCVGRGKQLFTQPHHDAGLFEATFGSIPMGGFFCNGEIGTVGDRAFLHGFSASGALFENA